MMGSVKTVYGLVLIVLVCFTYAAQAENICSRHCPSKCIKEGTDQKEFECFFTCVDNCEKCPDNPKGCDEENKGNLPKTDLEKERGLTPAKEQGKPAQEQEKPDSKQGKQGSEHGKSATEQGKPSKSDAENEKLAKKHKEATPEGKDKAAAYL